MNAMIRRWLEVLQLLPCSVLVFLAYRKMGYYPSWLQAKLAVGSYYKEKNKLGAHVLIEYLWGFIPIGTLMCSVDNGWLPVDAMFTREMQNIRRDTTRLGYFGKFAVIPFLQGMQTGQKLIDRAIAWGTMNDIAYCVVIVNPKHVRYYRDMGFTLVAKSNDTTPGLEKAPARLMYLNRKDLVEVRVREAEEEADTTGIPAQVV